MTRAIILAVVDEPDDLQITTRLLHNRFGVDYQVVCEPSPVVALQRLAEWLAAERQVAVLLADQWMPDMTGTEFLARAHALYPHAKRLLLFERDDPSAAEPRFRSMALGQIDYYIVKPTGEPDEAFHQIITDFLVEWTGVHQSTFQMVQVVGEQWNPRSHEFRDLLERNGTSYGFYDVDSEEGQALLQRVQLPNGPFPVVILFNGTVLANPSVQEAAAALGAPVRPPEGLYDVLIIGGGPAGLSAAVYGASEGLRTLVIEREAVGGQAGTSSRIRNYLGFPRGVTGGELANRALGQAMLFGTNFYIMRDATGLRTEDNQHTVTLSDGYQVVSRTVVLATGVTYRRLGVPSLERFDGAGVFYGAALAEAKAMEGEPVFIVGGGNSAGQAAVYLAKYAEQVTMVVRGPSLSESMSDYLINEIQHCDNIDVRLQTQVIDGWGDYRLRGLVLRDTASGETIEVPATGLFILIGAYPHTDWLPTTIERDDQGYIRTGRDLIQDGALPKMWPLSRSPYFLETSVPGIFAVGDVRCRSVKRVASAVGEGSIAVQLIHEYLAEH